MPGPFWQSARNYVLRYSGRFTVEYRAAGNDRLSALDCRSRCKAARTDFPPKSEAAGFRCECRLRGNSGRLGVVRDRYAARQAVVEHRLAITDPTPADLAMIACAPPPPAEMSTSDIKRQKMYGRHR